jgi:hypothetical protein
LIHEIANYTQQLWSTGRKLKKSQSGWLSSNAVCCIHNGDSQDTRGRGGLMVNGNGSVSWHCFNCQFKTSYTPGRPLSFKFRKLLRWLGGDLNEIQRLVIEALRIKDLIKPEEIEEEKESITFERRSLPAEAKSFWALAEFYKLADNNNLPANFVHAVNYVVDRKIDCNRYDFYWTPEVEHKLAHRVIVPFKYKNEIVGYIARAINDGIKPKYHSNHPADFVFNLDNQRPDNKFVIVCEGTFDAMSVDGVSVQSNEISEQQAELIEQLGKPVIFVPDFDKHTDKQGREVWPGYAAVEQAVEYGWSVSFPVWRETCKDINSAVQKYGKLFVLKAILDAQESNPLKIKLMKNK